MLSSLKNHSPRTLRLDVGCSNHHQGQDSAGWCAPSSRGKRTRACSVTGVYLVRGQHARAVWLEKSARKTERIHEISTLTTLVIRQVYFAVSLRSTGIRVIPRKHHADGFTCHLTHFLQTLHAGARRPLRHICSAVSEMPEKARPRSPLKRRAFTKRRLLR